jgi:hypothetical protein
MGKNNKILSLNENQIKKIIKETVKRILNEQYGVDMQDTLAWVRKKFPNKSNAEQIKFAQNIINKTAKSMASSTQTKPQNISSTQTKPQNNINDIGKVGKNVDPNGILDGVTDIGCYKYCGTDYIIIFDAKNTNRLDGIRFIADSQDKRAQELEHKVCKKYLSKFWPIRGSVVDYGNGNKILQLCVS